MSAETFLIFHKDCPLAITGVNSGAEMATRNLALQLAALGKRVIVCAELSEPEQTYCGVEFWDLGATYDVSSALIRARSYHSYHVISAGRAYPLLRSREESACRSRLLISHDPSGDATGIRNDIMCEVADYLVCVSEAQRKLFLDAKAPASKVVVVPNGVDFEIFHPSASPRRDPFRLVFVGALVPHKGLHLLLEAFVALKQRFPELSLDVFGSAKLWNTDEYLNVDALSSQLPDVHFHGAQSQAVVADALRTASISVQPSIWFEAFPLSSLEAQASGCPVVAFDVGGMQETMLRGETGILCESISSESLFNTLSALLEDPARVTRMGARAAEVTRERFQWKRTAEHIARLAATAATQKSVPRSGPSSSKKVGIITTWNQHCGLATYARYLASSLQEGSYAIFAENVAERTTADEPFVHRCWTRERSETLIAAVTGAKCDVLLLNFHDHSFIPAPDLLDTLSVIRDLGIPIVCLLHTTYAAHPRLRSLFPLCDRLVVHTPQNRQQLIALGASARTIDVIPHGVHRTVPLRAEERAHLRVRYGIRSEERLIVAPGFIQPNKGVEAVLEAVAHTRAQGLQTRGIIVGKVNERHPHAGDYFRQLTAAVQKLQLGDWVQFLDRFVDDKELFDYFAVADLIMMNYQSAYHEASGICSLAVGSGKAVAVSLSPTFAPFGDAVWAMTAGFPASVSAELLLADESPIRTELVERAFRYAEENSWEVTADRFSACFERAGHEHRGRIAGSILNPRLAFAS